MKSSRLIVACSGYALLIVGAWIFGRQYAGFFAGLNFTRALISFSLLFAPLWFFGFGAAEPLRRASTINRIIAAGTLALPYFAYSLGTPHFYWRAALIVIALPILLAAFLALPNLPPRMTWRDLAAIAIIAVAYFQHWLRVAWPAPVPAVFSKLFLADIAIYCFFIARAVEGATYSLVPTKSALWIGIREWMFYLPIAFVLGTAIGFIHFHATIPHVGTIISAVLLTALLIALPEELFFRAILQNLLETRFGRTAALFTASILFGLSHFAHGPYFNWRYVLLASIAGIFYGRGWRTNRQIVAAVVTHTAVDVVWSLWFR